MDAVKQQLLQSLLKSGSSISEEVAPADMLRELGANNPKAAIIAQYLAQLQAAQADDVPTEDDDTEWEEAHWQNRDREDASVTEEWRDLQQTVEAMYTELEELRERNDMLAAALGACNLCWGENPACQECQGRGSPGSLPPDRELFADLVIPAARRLQQGKAKRARYRVQPESIVPSTKPDERRRTERKQ